MEIALPKMGELLVMMMMMISPSGREVPPAESLRRRAKVLLPKFRLEAAALHPDPQGQRGTGRLRPPPQVLVQHGKGGVGVKTSGSRVGCPELCV